jgi:16S rRNA (guanine527-N7)-methyltransferase
VNNEKQMIISGAAELGVSITEYAAATLEQYLDILEATNRSFNLTRIPREDYITLHILDSLATLTSISRHPGMKILDIGTGAGFPGVPLAAAIPEAQVTLLDSTLKKVRFAAETAKQCGIKNCEGLHNRAEVLAKDKQHRGRYDVVVSRAVASFDTLIQLMAPFVAPDGCIIALKGARAHEELNGTTEILKRLRCSDPIIKAVSLPGTDVERYLVILKRAVKADGNGSVAQKPQ